jgi:cobyrinic acid a,c-diamide synthase
MSHLLISAAHKSSGKTTISIGLCAALTDRGYQVQPFKKGPDYIDPKWLGKACKRDCYNLDFYTMDNEEIQNTFMKRMHGADIGIIEGNKGLYDGLDLTGSNSNAALAELLHAPVVLVLDARGMTRGIAPLVLGYQAFDPEIKIAGVILNKVGGSRHEDKLRAILEHYTDVEVIGAVYNDPDMIIDERHLGLVPSNESVDTDNKISEIGKIISKQVDIDKIMEYAKRAVLQIPTPIPASIETRVSPADVRIGVIQDSAFGFYYPDDLEALKHAGSELVGISALNDTELPQIDGLFIGGGFPETHMEQLQANTQLRNQIYNAVEAGLPVYAECGGLMYLSRNITWRGKTCEMVGSVPANAVMHDKPQGRGYIQLEETGNGLWPKQEIGPGNKISGHEFHYSSLTNLDESKLKFAFKLLRGSGIDGKHDGIVYKNVQANYAHLRNVKNNQWASRFVSFVRDIRQQKSSVTRSAS